MNEIERARKKRKERELANSKRGQHRRVIEGGLLAVLGCVTFCVIVIALIVWAVS